MRLSFEQDLPAHPAAVWPFLTEPEKLARWSRADVHAIEPGDGGGPGDVGALRRITIRAAGMRASFEEVIEHAEPPKRLVYRVVSGLPLRAHRGEITLAKDGCGAWLRWDVDAAFLVPALAIGARAILDGELRASLDALARAVRGEPEIALEKRSFRDDLDELPALEREAERALAEQRALADRLAQAQDPKRWFTRVYQYVTERQLSLCNKNRLTNRAWVMRLIPRFHAYYVDNLRRYLGELPGRAESHWQEAFRAMDRAIPARLDEGLLTVKGLLAGVAAHIEEDLPRTLAEVYRAHYAGRCAYVRFRADYLLMAGIFQHAADRLLRELPRDLTFLPMRALRPLLPLEIEDRAIAFCYDVPRRRRQAFERGARLAVWQG
jgi:carbon monoxide dehydrogenase subunit G